MSILILFFFFFSSRRRHTRFDCDWSSDVCSSDLLDREHVLELAVVALRPEVVAVGDVHELRGHAEPIARLADAAFEDRGDLELAPDVADVLAPSFERERGGS